MRNYEGNDDDLKDSEIIGRVLQGKSTILSCC